MRISEQSPDEALAQANRFSHSEWQWMRYAADSDVLMLGYHARANWLAFHRPCYVRLPRSLSQATFTLSTSEEDAIRGDPDEVVVKIEAQEREFWIVCRGVTFLDGRDVLFREQPIRGNRLRGADLRDADLGGKWFSRADLSGADLRGADLRYVELSNCSLNSARLDRACLRHAVLRQTRLSGASLRDADLTNASDWLYVSGFCWTRGTNFSGADLTEAVLKRGCFTRVNMARAILTGADLGRALLYGGSFRGAQLRGANLRQARFFNVDLQGADLAGADLAGIHYDRETRWPKGFTPPPASPYPYGRFQSVQLRQENLALIEEIDGCTLQWWALELTHGEFRLQVLDAPNGPLEIRCLMTMFVDLPRLITNARVRSATIDQIQQILNLLPQSYRRLLLDSSTMEEGEAERFGAHGFSYRFTPVMIQSNEGQFALIAREYWLVPLDESYNHWLGGLNRLLWQLGRRPF